MTREPAEKKPCARADARAPLVVWRWCDGKPGHDRQSAGLAEALAALTATVEHRFDARATRPSVVDALYRRFADDIPRPDLLIGAGRLCQWPLLAARHARGGFAVYLMRPGVPVGWFDLCLIPRHDRPRESPRVVVTDGVLNDVVPGDGGRHGLVLVGGPSKHHRWDVTDLITAISTILARCPDKPWIIADSRRTPAATSSRLRSLSRDGVTCVSAQDVGPDWLRAQYARADTAWVTTDSVSMLYECLSAGLAVGAIEVPVRRRDRISAVADDLAARGLVVHYRDWCDGTPLVRHAPLAEAARCAAEILARIAPRPADRRRHDP